MTAKPKTPAAIARAAKLKDTTPKPRVPTSKAPTKRLTQYLDDSASTELSAGFDESKPPTEKQRLFVKFWAEGNPILLAARMAGYSDNGTLAYRLVKRPNILAIYEYEKKKYEEASQMTRKQVMDGLLEGVQMGKYKEDPMAVISGWREIGKMCGYYEPVRKKLDITVNGNIMVDRMNRMSDEELFRLIQEGVQEAAPALLDESEGGRDGEDD